MSLGLWTEKRFFLFDPSNELGKYILEDAGYISEVLDSVMKTRAVVYQLLPFGTVLSIFVQSTSKVSNYFYFLIPHSKIYLLPNSMEYFVPSIQS